jgi:hypothetical protein
MQASSLWIDFAHAALLEGFYPKSDIYARKLDFLFSIAAFLP